MIEKEQDLKELEAAAKRGAGIHYDVVPEICATIRALWAERTSWEKRMKKERERVEAIIKEHMQVAAQTETQLGSASATGCLVNVLERIRESNELS
jgi:hypothetical protein